MKKFVRFMRQYKLFSLSLIAVVAGLILMALGHKSATNIVLAVISIIALLPLLWGMWEDLKSGKYGVDILAATAIIASVALGQYWAGIVVVVMLTGGEALENYAEHRAKRELDSLLKHAPRKATLLKKGKLVEVKVSEIHVGDKIFIKAGELVAVDSIITEGGASFDESSLTGESLPEARQIGDKLLSGSINLDGAVTAKATSTAEDSQYQQIIKLVQSAATSQAPFVRLADRYSIPFTLLAYAIAGAVWVLTGDAIRFLEVIVVATPCPLILAAPIALISGMSRASRYGIIVKNGSALEKLAQAKIVAFDKTGTLTSGILQVDGVETFGDNTSEQVLTLAASLENNSNHVLASAIVSAAKTQSLKLIKAKHVKEISGRGLEATIKRQDILVGRLSLLLERGVTMPANFKGDKLKQTAVFVAIDGELAGYITLQDELRPETPATLAKLKQLGVQEFMMVTGDNQAVADNIAGQLGIRRVHAEALPADKLHILDKIKLRPIAFVGDGVNDAPILTASDVGIALGARGSTVASESADVVIMQDDFSRVAMAFAIATRTFYIARQSILIGIGLSVGLMLAFATGKFSPLAGAIVQEVVDVFVILNALRAHSTPLKI